MRISRFSIKLLALLALTLILDCASTSTTPIKNPSSNNSNSISSLEKIILGGVEQWILIRGNDIRNPILLKIHGGPGQAEMATAPYNSFLERDFIVVEWDQRGAGKSYASYEPETAMTMEQFVSDTIELSHNLLQRFKQKKLLLVGHSWGSVIALKVANSNPELFHAVVTTGQIISLKASGHISHAYLMESARSSGNQDAVEELIAIGAPPYLPDDANKKLSTYFRYLQSYKADWHAAEPLPRVRLMISSPEYSWYEKLKFTGAASRSFRLLYPQLAQVDFRNEISELKIPVHFALGRYDKLQPGELAEEYLHKLKAPVKSVRWFENSAHFPFLEEKEEFASFLRSVMPQQ